MGGAIIKNNYSFTCIRMINPATSWFEISEVLMYELNEITADNDEYIYIYHLLGLAICLTTPGYADTRVHANFCLTFSAFIPDKSVYRVNKKTAAKWN